MINFPLQDENDILKLVEPSQVAYKWVVSSGFALFVLEYTYEPVHGKINNLHRRKQSRRSASQ